MNNNKDHYFRSVSTFITPPLSKIKTNVEREREILYYYLDGKGQNAMYILYSYLYRFIYITCNLGQTGQKSEIAFTWRLNITAGESIILYTTACRHVIPYRVVVISIYGGNNTSILIDYIIHIYEHTRVGAYKYFVI